MGGDGHREEEAGGKEKKSPLKSGAKRLRNIRLFARHTGERIPSVSLFPVAEYVCDADFRDFSCVPPDCYELLADINDFRFGMTEPRIVFADAVAGL